MLVQGCFGQNPESSQLSRRWLYLRIPKLEFADSLTPANWTALPAVTGDGTVIVLMDPAATNQQRFYRVHVQ